jgi:hypothetical protein
MGIFKSKEWLPIGQIIAEVRDRLIDGWVCLVGMTPKGHNMLRIVSEELMVDTLPHFFGKVSQSFLIGDSKQSLTLLALPRDLAATLIEVFAGEESACREAFSEVLAEKEIPAGAFIGIRLSDAEWPEEAFHLACKVFALSVPNKSTPAPAPAPPPTLQPSMN